MNIYIFFHIGGPVPPQTIFRPRPPPDFQRSPVPASIDGFPNQDFAVTFGSIDWCLVGNGESIVQCGAP